MKPQEMLQKVIYAVIETYGEKEGKLLLQELASMMEYLKKQQYRIIRIPYR